MLTASVVQGTVEHAVVLVETCTARYAAPTSRSGRYRLSNGTSKCPAPARSCRGRPQPQSGTQGDHSRGAGLLVARATLARPYLL